MTADCDAIHHASLRSAATVKGTMQNRHASNQTTIALSLGIVLVLVGFVEERAEGGERCATIMI